MATSNNTNKTKKWCVKKCLRHNDPWLISLSELTNDDWNWMKDTQRAIMLNPAKPLPKKWIKLVPDQLNALAGEIQELTESDNQEEKSYGLNLLEVLMDPNYQNASPVQVLQAMLPRIMWKISNEIWAITDFYQQNNDAIEELIAKLTSEPNFPETLDEADKLMMDDMPEFKYFCIARDESLQMAIKQRKSDYIPGKL